MLTTNSYQFTVIYEPVEGDIFLAKVPALPGCISYGKTLPEAEANIREAVECHVESMLDDGLPIPVESPEWQPVTKPMKITVGIE